MNQMSALRRFGWTICLSVIALAYFRQPAAAVEIAAGPKGFAQVKPFLQRTASSAMARRNRKRTSGCTRFVVTFPGTVTWNYGNRFWSGSKMARCLRTASLARATKNESPWCGGSSRHLRDAVNARPAQTPLARRLTNFEYENTVRDLLGFELKLIDDLPKDPVKPYHFNNTAEFMQTWPDRLTVPSFLTSRTIPLRRATSRRVTQAKSRR